MSSSRASPSAYCRSLVNCGIARVPVEWLDRSRLNDPVPLFSHTYPKFPNLDRSTLNDWDPYKHPTINRGPTVSISLSLYIYIYIWPCATLGGDGTRHRCPMLFYRVCMGHGMGTRYGKIYGVSVTLTVQILYSTFGARPYDSDQLT